mmetsp:Transcript_61765/g.114663  ORF Transcript_61765/g.114663 Transcript_61765/m.114663 type:complete len:344 (-) Transcript_61765:24-1055(-)
MDYNAMSQGFDRMDDITHGFQSKASNMYGTMKAAALPLNQELWRLPHRRRPRLTAAGVAIGFFFPWLFFIAVCYIMSSEFRYVHSGWSYFLCAVALGIVAYLGYRVKQEWFTVDKEGYAKDVTWALFVFLATLGAWIGAVIVGTRIYYNTTVPYNDILRLDNYAEVDPSTSRGQAYMDSGRIRFVSDAKLDLDKPMGFKNLDTYCVAPIVRKGHTSEVYDFWAIGLNCCDQQTYDPRRVSKTARPSGPYECGQYENALAKSGLRLLRADQREFYRLAVQEAESAYGIQSTYPLFFFWEEDVDAAWRTYLTEGRDFYLMAVATHFCIQSLLLVMTIVGIGLTAV